MRLLHQIMFWWIGLLWLCVSRRLQMSDRFCYFLEFRFHFFPWSSVPLPCQSDDARGRVLDECWRLLEGSQVERGVRRAHASDGLPHLKIQDICGGENTKFLCCRLGVLNSQPEHNEAADVAKDSQ